MVSERQGSRDGIRVLRVVPGTIRRRKGRRAFFSHVFRRAGAASGQERSAPACVGVSGDNLCGQTRVVGRRSSCDSLMAMHRRRLSAGTSRLGKRNAYELGNCNR